MRNITNLGEIEEVAFTYFFMGYRMGKDKIPLDLVFDTIEEFRAKQNWTKYEREDFKILMKFVGLIK